MCKRKARMRGGGEGGRKCAFGGANFSKDGKAHNLCDAAKGAGCHLFARCRCCKAAGGNPLEPRRPLEPFQGIITSGDLKP
jgi:hypothetical protein